MIIRFRNISQIRQSSNLNTVFCEVFVHIPHVDHEAELIRMWFRHHIDGADYVGRWPLKSRVRAPASTISLTASLTNSLCSNAEGAFGDYFVAGAAVSHNSM